MAGPESDGARALGTWVAGWVGQCLTGRCVSTHPFALPKQCYGRNLMIEYIVPDRPR